VVEVDIEVAVVQVHLVIAVRAPMIKESVSHHSSRKGSLRNLRMSKWMKTIMMKKTMKRLK
jgi:hypothetical protein